MPNNSPRSAGLLACLLFSLSTLAGCSAKDSDGVLFQKGVYEQALERQRAGMAMKDGAFEELEDASAARLEQLGDRFLAQGEPGMAYVRYQKALELEPGRVSARYKSGVILLRSGHPDQAMAVFELILSRNSQEPLGFLGRGQARLAMGEPRQAEGELLRAIELDPSRWKARHLLGLAYDRMNRHQEAIQQYLTALQIHPDDPAMLNDLGVSYFQSGDVDSAIAMLERGVYFGPKQPQVWNNLGRAYAGKGRYRDALRAFGRLSKPGRAENNLGVLLVAQGRLKKAAACFEKAIDAGPTYYERARENLDRATADLKAKNYRTVSGDNGRCP